MPGGTPSKPDSSANHENLAVADKGRRDSGRLPYILILAVRGQEQERRIVPDGPEKWWEQWPCPVLQQGCSN